MDSSQINMALVAKYLCHETDQSESAEVENWISQSDGNRMEFEKLRVVWDRASAYAGFGNWNTEKRKIEFLKKIAETERAERIKLTTSDDRRLRIIRDSLKYAAAVAFIAMLTVVAARTLKKDTKIAGSTSISAARGSKTEMVLVDGSKVILNAGSSLRYESSYNGESRDVYLDGEGYFKVKGNASKPFRVHAGKVTVEAVGTVFNVKAYPDEDLVETTLVEGRVSVSAGNNPDRRVLLSPNEQANYYKTRDNERKAESFLIIRGVNTGQNTSWINDQLIIANESLASLAVKLGRKYDVNFNFADTTLTQLRYTGTLNNETIEQVLDILKISSPLNYRIEKREIWIYKDQL